MVERHQRGTSAIRGADIHMEPRPGHCLIVRTGALLPELEKSTIMVKHLPVTSVTVGDVETSEVPQRTPLSKQRNKHLQTTLMEAAKMAPRYSPTLALLYDKERQKGNANRATLAVARKLVAYLMSVDRGQTHFRVRDRDTCAAA